jgi:lactate 2-monooxygenase
MPCSMLRYVKLCVILYYTILYYTILYHSMLCYSNHACIYQIGIPFIVSSVSSTSLESIAESITQSDANAPAPWFQLYNSSVPALSLSMLRRAKQAGYGAIVVTLDTAKYGYRTEELDAAYFPQADTRFKWCQMTWDPVFNSILKAKMNCVASEEFSENGKYPVDRLKANLTALSLVGCGLGDKWSNDDAEESDTTTTTTTAAADAPPVRENDTMKWFCDVIKDELDLPLVIKGIVHPADAVLAVMNGADGIIVSNHGGRQVDGALSSIEALPGVVKAVREYARRQSEVRGRQVPVVPVFLDSGIRYGQHVVKALALGATGVMVGRMPIIGASLGGGAGVQHVLLSLLADTQCTMMNSGYGSATAVHEASLPSAVWPLVVRAATAGPPPFLSPEFR